jgi:shikimate dehydrogenase
MTRYGLIGFPLSHSFSQGYFTEKFAREGIKNCRYDNFPLEHISELPDLLKNCPDLRGLNVTIPYKTAVIPYLDGLDPVAADIGAVNTLVIQNGRCTGYNTDAHGFRQSLLQMTQAAGYTGLPPGEALLLGRGGAALAVAWVFKQWNIPCRFVVRRPQLPDEMGYPDLRALDFNAIRWIVNTTPVGMYPNSDACPDLPFDRLHAQHFVCDLLYNPPETLLLQRASARGCQVQNGLDMLHAQAEKAWDIWQTS